MSICGRRPATAKFPTAQTTREDFCQIFTQEMNSLYLLSFFLTGDHEKAEQGFTAGMEDCVQGNPVFQEWARAWSRRAIIKNAIRIASPWTQGLNATVPELNPAEWNADIRSAFAVVAQMQPLDRFVYVMSVLERYSDHECATLLNTTKEQVVAARTRALRRLAPHSGSKSSAEVFRGLLVADGRPSPAGV